MIILLKGWIDENGITIYISFYLEQDSYSRKKVKVELDFSNYTTKSTNVVTSESGKKIDLGSLKSDVNKSDVHSFKTVPVNLSQQGGVVQNDIVKKTENDELVEKANAVNPIDVSKLVEKAGNNTIIENFKKKIINHDQYLAINHFNKFSSAIFREKLKQTKLSTEIAIADIIKKIYFHDKLNSTNKKITSNKPIYLEYEKKLIDISKNFFININ